MTYLEKLDILFAGGIEWKDPKYPTHTFRVENNEIIATKIHTGESLKLIPHFWKEEYIRRLGENIPYADNGWLKRLLDSISTYQADFFRLELNIKEI